MSHHTTIVQNTNVRVFIKSANAIIVNAGGSALGPVTSLSAAAKALEKALKAELPTSFKAAHGDDLPAMNMSFGYFSPFDKMKQGDVPATVVTQINQDLTNWQVPTTNNVAQQIAKTITTNLVSTAGQATVLSGTTAQGPNESVDWTCIAGSVPVDAAGTIGIAYVWGATSVIDIG